MPDFKRREALNGLTAGKPPLDNALARRPATRFAVHQQCKAQDRLWATGKRKAFEWGLAGQPAWTWPQTTPVLTPSTTPTHPDNVTEYVIGRVKSFHLTPGCHFRLDVLAILSGSTQVHDGSSGYVSGGNMGRIVASVTWTNEDAATESRDYEIDTPGSPEEFGAEGDDLFKNSLTYSADIYPEGILNSPTLTAKWSTPGIVADVTIKYVGHPRVVHGILWERPYAIARNYTDDNWAFHGYGSDGNDLSEYPHAYAVQQASDVANADPTRGTLHIGEVAAEQAKQLGPSILGWSSFMENVLVSPQAVYDTTSHGGNNPSATGDNEWPGLSGTNTASANVFDSTITGAIDMDAEPGWSIGSGGYGMNYPQNGAPMLGGNTGCARFRIGAYIKTSGVGNFTVRLYTEAWSYVDLTTSSVTYEWVEAVAYLECGRNPEDAFRMIGRAIQTSAGTWSLRGLTVQRLPELP